MSGTTIAAVWPLAPQIVAQVLGLPYEQYRPQGTGPVFTAGNLVNGALPAWITADPKLMAAKPFAYGKAVGFAAVDPTQTQVGDYLLGSLTLAASAVIGYLVVGQGHVDGGVTFFVASQDIPAPIQVVYCNQTLSITRPADETPGQGAYGGAKRTGGTPIITSWPASVLQGKSPLTGETRLPGDTKLARVEILLPISCPELRMGDVARDAQAEPNIYTISYAELTPLGWRCEAWVANA